MLLRILSVAGRALVALGILVLLFTAYQLWGTGILESHSQTALRTQLSQELPPGAAARTRREVAGPAVPSRDRGGGGGSSVRTASPIAAPATGNPIGIIQIPSIGLDQVVVEGVQAAQLRTGPGHYPGTPLPGEAGNVAIAGHRTTYARPFYDLDAVAPGDKIVITTSQGVFLYTAGSSSVVSPTDVAVIGPTPGAQLTLTTCNPRYSASTRLVLHATLTQSYLFPTAGRADTTGGAGGSGGTDTAGGAGATGGAARPHGDRTAEGKPGGKGGGGLAGTGGGGDWLPAMLWGLAVVVVAVGVRLAARRVRRVRRRWAVYLPGIAAVAVVLYVFFTVLSPLLPASL